MHLGVAPWPVDMVGLCYAGYRVLMRITGAHRWTWWSVLSSVSWCTDMGANLRIYLNDNLVSSGMAICILGIDHRPAYASSQYQEYRQCERIRPSSIVARLIVAQADHAATIPCLVASTWSHKKFWAYGRAKFIQWIPPWAHYSNYLYG